MTALVTVWLVLALACHVGAHLALLFGLAARRPRYRVLLGLLIPPLAPYWGWDAGMRKRALVWAGTLAAYAAGVGLAAI